MEDLDQESIYTASQVFQIVKLILEKEQEKWQQEKEKWQQEKEKLLTIARAENYQCSSCKQTYMGFHGNYPEDFYISCRNAYMCKTGFCITCYRTKVKNIINPKTYLTNVLNYQEVRDGLGYSSYFCSPKCR